MRRRLCAVRFKAIGTMDNHPRCGRSRGPVLIDDEMVSGVSAGPAVMG